ncbi:hypothetical protein GCM10022254_71200 [Actinomadura meridiana]|uniref:DUF4190 domain-containing protein n=1 Tax=Actinomadura meridiana TaxID=559626 RepID=A0ABP8CNS6_9ACTN
MSGYGGSPPSGWQDPYGGSQGWDAYGQQQGPGYYPPPGYGYGPPGVPYGTASNGGAIAALVCNAVLVVLCCNIIAIPGVITASIALGRTNTDPRSARKLMIWSWSLFAASIVIAVIAVVVLMIIGATSEPDYDSTGGV